ncbi:hypothetical protein OG625_14050 [Streptomyces sp. NBC_01351]|uniref:hypothetical protein n=1 Tax=Streptomyces sp. NBC_01351 TaxID=2903833 RepID=UPI002E3340F5|nr:hypothetical protein [Streptomyces sp. NBC_01351]
MDVDDEPPEHRRYATYLRALEAVTEADEARLVRDVLRDEYEYPGMADSAVALHMERRATDLLTGPRFAEWARTMEPLIADRGLFLTRRLHEWTLLRALALGEPWAPVAVLGASDWFQRMASTTQIVTSSDALAMLAEFGRTRRVRNAASRRLRELEQAGRRPAATR